MVIPSCSMLYTCLPFANGPYSLTPKINRMNKKLLSSLMLFCMLLACYTGSFAQSRKPVELVKDAMARNKNFEPLRINASPEATGKYAATLRSQVNDYTLFSFDRAATFASKAIGALELELPSAKGSITLQLAPVNIYAEGFSVKTSSGEKVMSTGWFYQGIIKGDEQSIAAISIFEDEIGGFISSAEGNYVIGKLRNTGNKEPVNIIYKESSLSAKPSFSCSTPDIALPVPPANELALTNRSVRIYYETEVDYYTAFGNNATSVTNYVTNLFNQNKTLYNNDGICVSLSQIFVWTTTDPYTGTNTSTMLSQFQATRTSFNGDIGQLITTRTVGGGQAAVIYGLCGTVANRLCVSGDMSTSFPNVPTYSWSVMVTTHELGHLMGSRHTHACVWNGNNTAIDGCSGFVEGSCGLPGIPSGGGTIMSYCHLQSVGINFSNGFGPQPGAQIRNSVDASACLGSCESAPPCATAVGGLSASNITTTSATVSWSAMSGANGYIVEYKPSSSSTWTVLPLTAFTSASLTGLTAGTAYDWRVKAVCNCDVNSPYATSSFSTALPCGTPGGLSASGISSSSATVSWAAVSGAVSYTVEYKPSTSSTWTVFGNVTTTAANLSGLTASTTYDWRVKTNCSSDGSGYASSSFTTLSAPPCTPPTGMFASPDGCAGVTYLSWNAVAGATSYVIEIKFSTATTWTVYETAWPYTSYDAYGNGNYNWRMKANCPGGASDYSAIVNYNCRYIPRICEGDGGPFPKTNPAGTIINVNPQPASGTVNISFAWNKNAGGLLLITNQYGKTALRKNVQLQKGNNNVNVDVTGITPGIYTIRLLSGGRSATRKLVIGN